MPDSAASPHPLSIQAVLFDLDGTLADTAADLAAALNRLRAERNLDPVATASLRAYTSHGARGLLEAGMNVRPGHSEYTSLRDAFLEQYDKALCAETTLFEGADELLTEIERRGLRWGIVTNKISRFTLPILRELELHHRAGAIVCGDTTAHSKPHPAPLLAAALALEVAPGDCVYVGDAERDIQAGLAARMKTLVARYGYIRDDEHPETWGADGSVATPGEILAWLPAFSRDMIPR